MAPRNTGRVRIVSPNSGHITLSRSRGSSLSSLKNSSHNTSTSGKRGFQFSQNTSNRSSRAVSPVRTAQLRPSFSPAHPPFSRQEDEAAVERAKEAFSSAVVLRRTGKRSRSKVEEADKSTEDAKKKTPVASREHNKENHNTSTRSSRSRPADKGLHLPRYIPIHRGNSSVSSTAPYGEEEDSDLRQMPLLRRKMGEDTTYASTYSALKQSFAERRTAEPADQPPAAPVEDRLCPGMFKGLSAVQLPGNLFEPVDTLIASHHVQQRNAEPEVNRAARRGARPLWCLVGTFKTSLTSVVQVDYAQDSLHWSQRNPRGGYQPIRVPLSQIEQVFVTRVTQSDEDIEEKQFMVVVRTSTRPSQVVFGFSGLGEANQFKKFFEK